MTAIAEEMNLLALLSPMPAPVRLLMDDLGLELQREVYALTKKLRLMGHDIQTGMIENSNERGIWIERKSWPESYRAAMAHAEKE